MNELSIISLSLGILIPVLTTLTILLGGMKYVINFNLFFTLVFFFLIVIFVFYIKYSLGKTQRDLKNPENIVVGNSMKHIGKIISDAALTFIYYQGAFSIIKGSIFLTLLALLKYIYFFLKPPVFIVNHIFEWQFVLFAVLGLIIPNIIGFFSFLFTKICSLHMALSILHKKNREANFMGYVPGIATALIVVGLGILLTPLMKYISISNTNTSYAQGLMLGMFTTSVINRFSVRVFTKSADIAADIVGKLHFNLEEDSMKNPAAFADNVGDLVGDGNGNAQVLGSIFIAYLVGGQFPAIIFPLSICLISGITSLLISLFVAERFRRWNYFTIAYGVSLFVNLMTYGMALGYMNGSINKVFVLSALFLAIMPITLFFLSSWLSNFIVTRHAKWVAKQSNRGTSITILNGLISGIFHGVMNIILFIFMSFIMKKSILYLSSLTVNVAAKGI